MTEISGKFETYCTFFAYKIWKGFYLHLYYYKYRVHKWRVLALWYKTVYSLLTDPVGFISISCSCMLDNPFFTPSCLNEYCGILMNCLQDNWKNCPSELGSFLNDIGTKMVKKLYYHVEPTSFNIKMEFGILTSDD